MNQFIRTECLIGANALEKLANSKVLIFGVGGVGGYVCEALARSGVGALTLVDHDTISESNINRQIVATYSTIGQYKVDVMKQRILDINPHAQVEAKKCFFLPENQDEFDFSSYDMIVDCIDTVTAKIQIICEAKAKNIPVISSMGAGNRLNPSDLAVMDLYDTNYDPLAKVMRRELKKRGIKKLKVVASKEIPLKPHPVSEEELLASGKRSVPGSSSFVPSACGLILASEVVKDLIKNVH